MLTWMEQHDAPFACTTNLPDRLDPASLRRFLIKLRFDWMTLEQAQTAVRRFFGMAPRTCWPRWSRNHRMPKPWCGCCGRRRKAEKSNVNRSDFGCGDCVRL